MSPMGIVSSDEFESQVKDSGTPIITERPKIVVPEIIPMRNEHGRNEGDVNVPNSVRNLIGATRVEDGRREAIELAKSLGISPSSVSAYSHGSTSTSSYDETPNRKTINGVKERLGKSARVRLAMALRHITPAKMEQTTVRELAGVAKDMAVISKAMEPDFDSDNESSKNPVQFVFYAPQVNQEINYKTIAAKDDF